MKLLKNIIVFLIIIYLPSVSLSAYKFFIDSNGGFILNNNKIVSEYIPPIPPPSGDTFPSNMVMWFDMEATNNLGWVLDMTNSYNGEPKPTFATGPTLLTTNGTKVYSFDNTDDRFSIPDADAFSASNGFTICGWVAYNTSSGLQSFCNRYSSGNREFIFYLNNRTWYGYVYQVNSGSTFIGRYWQPISSITNMAWNFVAMTYDGGLTRASIKLYLNGVQRDDTDGGSASISAPFGNTTATTSFGYIEPINYYPYDGFMDDLQFYNRPLSTNELIQVMNATKGSK